MCQSKQSDSEAHSNEPWRKEGDLFSKGDPKNLKTINFNWLQVREHGTV